MDRALRRDINVTPLVDIVLVLLIVFIIAAPAVDSSVSLPVAKHADKGAAAGPRISLRREGGHARARLELEGRPASSFRIGEGGEGAALAAALQRLDPARGGGAVQVKADAAIPNGLVGELLAACRAGGATRAIIITSEETGSPSRRL